MGATLEVNNLLFYEQILTFNSTLSVFSDSSSRETNRKSQNLFPFVKLVLKHKGVSVALEYTMALTHMQVHEYILLYTPFCKGYIWLRFCISDSIHERPSPEVINIFSCSAQLNMEL